MPISVAVALWMIFAVVPAASLTEVANAVHSSSPPVSSMCGYRRRYHLYSSNVPLEATPCGTSSYHSQLQV